MSRNLREYIRNLIVEDGTYAFNEAPVQYNPSEILKESKELSRDFCLVNENMELAYFHLNSFGDVDGAAWIDKSDKFNFAIATMEDSSNFVFESLVQDCMDEFFSLNEKNNIILEVKVEDYETETYLKDQYGLKPIRQYPGIVIMGNK